MEKNTYAEVRYYSTATICKMLDVSRAWLWDQVNAGHFPKPIKFGRLARYKAEDVEHHAHDSCHNNSATAFCNGSAQGRGQGFGPERSVELP